MKLHLLVIDPQNDFCNPNGSLYVPGAEEDMKRLARMVERLKGKLDDIHVTLDSHRRVDISHPMWWKDSAGKAPGAFTMISPEDLRSGKMQTAIPSFHKRSLEYLEALEKTGRYPHTIWPEHCLIGDEGHNVSPLLSAAIHDWESRFAQADFVTKGSNPWTEHFSAVRAEVPDPQDPTTQINAHLIDTLEEADMVLLAGEASTHCLMNTVSDIVDAFQDSDTVKKLMWLTDATSPVPDPPGTTIFSDRFSTVFADLCSRGMRTGTTEDVLKQSAVFAHA